MGKQSEYEIRVLERGEVEHAVAWAAREGWNPGLADADAFAAVDPGGFFGGFLGGELVAVISAIRYDAGYGFVGFYIVDPDHRGQGLGLRLWNAALAHLDGVRTVGLDGVVDQQDNYRASGFVLAHRNGRYAGHAPFALAPASESGTIRDAEGVSFDDLVAYDAAHFGTPRPGFVHDWITLPGHRARVAVDADAVRGFGVLRPCGEGLKVGPLFAEDAGAARALLADLVAEVPDSETVFLDPPTTNPEALALVAELGMDPVFETARMYRGPALDLPIGEVFGISTFELG
ncbi:GNAT family N-acetyltransferase [Microbacterium sediminicola]|uniref:GNAT family N-acetyltransferase n=1 Tax=Microbacterium sediminicola TaxID=415210 RepID=A0ABP4TVX7_9MICO